MSSLKIISKTQNDWDRFFLGLAEYYASASKDPSTKVGAVLVDPDSKLVVGLGYNGFARGVVDTEERLTNRELKYKLVVHAEVNALIMAGVAAEGCTLYVYPSFIMPPICHDCCKTAIQFGVQEIVGYTPDVDAERQKRWAESIALSRQMCSEAGISWREVSKSVPMVSQADAPSHLLAVPSPSRRT